MFVNVPPPTEAELPASTRTALQLRGTAAAYTLSTGVPVRPAVRYALCQATIRLASSRIFIAAFLSRLC